MNIPKKEQLDKSCIYLNVFFNNKEFNNSPIDILTDARNKYFISRGKKIKDKVFFTADGIKYSFTYQIDPKGKFKWRTTINGNVTEEIATEPAGYIILYKNTNGAVNKKMYFNHSHIWQKTEYFNTNTAEPVVCLMPWLNDDRAAIAMYDATSSFPQILYALPLTDNTTELQRAVAICQPEVTATVNNVTYYFGDDETEEKWLGIIKSATENTATAQKQSEVKEYFNVSALKENSQFKNLADTTEVFTAVANTPVQPVAQPVFNSQPVNKAPEVQSEAQVVQPVQEIPQPVIPAPTVLPSVPNMQSNNKKKSTDTNTCEASADKVVMLSQKEKGLYFGALDELNNRNGYGRTQTTKGQTVYEGEYKDDMKNGFGVSFFKTGKVSYVGNYLSDKYNGFGIEFRATDGSVTVADYSDNAKKFIYAKFDKNGRFTFAGNRTESQQSGINFNAESGEMFIAKYKNGEPLQYGTIISADGTLIYNGEYKNGNKDGKGILFNPDGSIKYTGDFKRNLYSGSGVLTYENGDVYSGEFSAGQPNGTGKLSSSTGAIIYTGQWKKGLYNGDGRLYNPDGSYSDGKFQNGVAKGRLVIYDANGLIKYNGAVVDSKPDGNGICYENGQKVYDGQISDGVKSGTGRLYSNGECIYMGSFENDVFSGFGIKYNNSRIEYSGMWSNNTYNGAGLLTIDDETSMAGNFTNGLPNGRINIIKKGILISECIYNNGECEYMREYSEDGLSVVYDGNIKANLREGMGCTFTEYGEKLFEGIFKNGQPLKSMKVSTREMQPLEYVSKLKDTDYEKFRTSREFVVEQPMMNGVYSGQLNNGVPDGKGTVLYIDHRYTGCFSNGSACGSGVVYFGDGTVVSGVFSDKPLVNTQAIEFANVVYHIINNR
ncbi:MAG: hypothetical protein UHY68_07330 [Acutalibacteraceae bacterium]|nr:hypothetical protein [Acutalibacteraceae bacterium]